MTRPKNPTDWSISSKGSVESVGVCSGINVGLSKIKLLNNLNSTVQTVQVNIDDKKFRADYSPKKLIPKLEKNFISIPISNPVKSITSSKTIASVN